MIKAICHCEKVSFEIESKPETVTECNCSTCRRLGANWAYYKSPEVKVTAPEDSLLSYAWGDKAIDFHTCKNCGTTTHYTCEEIDRIAVNAKMFDLELLETIPVRHFDGARTWKYLD